MTDKELNEKIDKVADYVTKHAFVLSQFPNETRRKNIKYSIDKIFKSDEDLFLEELTNLSRKYKIGITGNPVLFVYMGLPDNERTYTSDEYSNLIFR